MSAYWIAMPIVMPPRATGRCVAGAAVLATSLAAGCSSEGLRDVAPVCEPAPPVPVSPIVRTGLFAVWPVDACPDGEGGVWVLATTENPNGAAHYDEMAVVRYDRDAAPLVRYTSQGARSLHCAPDAVYVFGELPAEEIPAVNGRPGCYVEKRSPDGSLLARTEIEKGEIQSYTQFRSFTVDALGRVRVLIKGSGSFSIWNQASWIVQGQAGSAIIALDEELQFVWVRAADRDYTPGQIALDSLGNTWVAGVESVGTGRGPLALDKYDSSGERLFTRIFGTGGEGAGEEGRTGDIAIDPAGDALLVGDFWERLIFDHVTLTPTNRDGDVFVTKLAADGSVRWARPYGGPGSEIVSQVIVTSDSTVWLAGRFEPQGGTGKPSLFDMPILNTPDFIEYGYIARLTQDGDLIAAANAGRYLYGVLAPAERGRAWIALGDDRTYSPESRDLFLASADLSAPETSCDPH